MIVDAVLGLLRIVANLVIGLLPTGTWGILEPDPEGIPWGSFLESGWVNFLFGIIPIDLIKFFALASIGVLAWRHMSAAVLWVLGVLHISGDST